MKTEIRTTETGSIITILPGGGQLLWGGTRRGVKLARPVQDGTLFDPEKTKCPFHREDEKSIAEFYDGEIRVLNNIFTPHLHHMLVIPRDCTDEAFVRTLGGEEFLRKTLQVIGEMATGTKEEKVFAVHVLRGQNVPHLHWHLYSYHPEDGLDLDREREWLAPEEDENLVIHSSRTIQVVSRGVEAGQLMFIPRDYTVNFTELVTAIHEIVTLTNRAFTSTEGHLPRYSLSGRISSTGQFRYLVYAPDVSMMGCSDILADFNGTARARAWSPVETAAFLKSHLK